MAKRNAEPYRPSNPPVKFTDWPRWIVDELYQLARAVTVDPVMMGINGSGSIDIGPVINIDVIGVGDVPTIDNPGGSWDSAAGEWTCSKTGVYSASISASISAFGAGNKSYYVRLQIFVNDVMVAESLDGGADDVPLGVTLAGPLELMIGDVLRAELAVEHEQFTGTEAYNYRLSYIFEAQLP